MARNFAGQLFLIRINRIVAMEATKLKTEGGGS